MKLNDWLMLAAIIIGPVASILIAHEAGKRKEKRDRKDRLFLSLISHRRSYPISRQFVDALNSVDVVFYGCRDVLEKWRAYYLQLEKRQEELVVSERDRALLDLLDAMAQELGYSKIKQTTLDRFYVPQQFADEHDFSVAYSSEVLRIARASSSFGTPSDRSAENQASLQQARTEE